MPQSLKKVILMELHKEHMGISGMKALARSHVWISLGQPDVISSENQDESQNPQTEVNISRDIMAPQKQYPSRNHKPQYQPPI